MSEIEMLHKNDAVLERTHDWPSGGPDVFIRAGMSARAHATPFRLAVRHLVVTGPNGPALWCSGGAAVDANQIWGSYCSKCAKLWKDDQERLAEEEGQPDCMYSPRRSWAHDFHDGVCTQCGVTEAPARTVT